MRDCRVSLTLAWLTFVLGGGVTGIVLARPLPWPTPQARLIECGVALLFVVCAFASALFHARHVVYVCVDPPAIRPSRSLALAQIVPAVGSLQVQPLRLNKEERQAGRARNGQSPQATHAQAHEASPPQIERRRIRQSAEPPRSPHRAPPGSRPPSSAKTSPKRVTRRKTRQHRARQTPPRAVATTRAASLPA